MTHSSKPTLKLSSSTGNEAVENYSIAPRNDPERPAVYASGDVYTFLATSKETNFAFNFFDFFIPPEGGPPTHLHPAESETWFVTEGELQYNLGNEGNDSLVVPEGTLVFGAQNRIHGYRNLDSTASILGETPGARTLSFTNPGNLDLYFDAISPRVIDRDRPIPTFNPTEEDFLRIAEYAVRTGAGIVFPESDFEPPDDTLNYVLVLPEDAEGKVVEDALTLAELDGFDIWTTGEHAGLPKRQTFTGDFGIEYTSLLTLEETGDEFAYNQFSLPSQTTNTFVQANLTGSQVIEPTESSATGVATLETNSEENGLNYSLTVTGLDFGELLDGGTAQTPNNESDDVTAIHIHSGKRGSDDSHTFNILDPEDQHEKDFDVTLNEDGSATISGTWSQTEKNIPTELNDFIKNNGVPGQESDFFFQIHTEGNQDGEIRGQITRTTDDFSDPVQSQNHELFYVTEGQLSVKINGEVRVVGPDTSVYIAPGNEYSLGNFSNTTVESLAVSVVELEESVTEIFSENTENELLSSPLKPQKSTSPDELIYLGEDADLFNTPNQSSRMIYGGKGNDELFSYEQDRLHGEEGDDILNSFGSEGGNQLYGGTGKDELLASTNDRLFGNEGDDFLDSSSSDGYNLLDGGKGNDLLLAGKQDQLVGGQGDDLLAITNGGDNLLYGGSGADKFRIVSGRLPNTVPEPRQSTQLPDSLPELPPLEDTRNTIADFEKGVDKIYLQGLDSVSSFEDLKLLPAFDDIQSTSIVATVEGVNGEVSLANVSGVIFNEFSAEDFVFA